MNAPTRYTIPIGIFFLTIVLFWFGTLSHIGLHADESWFGLKAADFIERGIDRPYGMNYYTGILQSLIDASAFKLFGKGVFQLRLGGVLLNTLSLLMIIGALVRRKQPDIAFYFLLLFAQCGLYLLYPKIAWEVCSLTLFFLTLGTISFSTLLDNKEQVSVLAMFVFLFSSLAGTYNHILYSSFPLGLITGYVMWKMYNRDHVLDKLFSLLLLNMINLVAFHLFMKFAALHVWNVWPWLTVLLPLIIIFIEVKLNKPIIDFIQKISAPIFRLNVSKQISIGLLIIAALSFLIIHSITFFEIVAQRILFLQLHSNVLPAILKWWFFIVSTVVFMYLGYSVIKDIVKQPGKPFAFLLTGYLGVFAIYTQSYSIRYYLIMGLLVLIYLAWSLARERKTIWKKSILFILIVNVIILQASLWNLSFNKTREVKAIDFKMGNNQNTETSAHFLPFDQVIDYARENQAGHIETSDTFFIENNFCFYKLIYPELDQFQDTINVEYNRGDSGDAFVIRED